MGVTSGRAQSMWHACAQFTAGAYFASAHRPWGELFTQFCCTRYSCVRVR